MSRITTDSGPPAKRPISKEPTEGPYAWGGATAASQEITPRQMRGQISAIFLFCLSRLGLVVGSVTIAGFTDSLFGINSALLWSSTLTILIAAPIAAVLLWCAGKPYCGVLAADQF